MSETNTQGDRMTDSRIIVALDFADAKSALELVSRLDPKRCRVKVGKELFTAAGPALVTELVRRGFGVFLDLKFHDIPNTAASACRAAQALGVWMLNVHALGGRAMLDAARDAVTGPNAPKLIAVTVLTSMTDADLADVGIPHPAQTEALRLAALTLECGLDGVVCSAREAPALRSSCGGSFLLVTPGIRLRESVADDQQRIVTPGEALANGSDYLVIGRPITRAPDPLAALDRIDRDISAARVAQ